jgi:hypothetical protein
MKKSDNLKINIAPATSKLTVGINILQNLVRLVLFLKGNLLVMNLGQPLTVAIN